MRYFKRCQLFCWWATFFIGKIALVKDKQTHTHTHKEEVEKLRNVAEVPLESVNCESTSRGLREVKVQPPNDEQRGLIPEALNVYKLLSLEERK